jgi:hypothetical protein
MSVRKTVTAPLATALAAVVLACVSIIAITGCAGSGGGAKTGASPSRSTDSNGPFARDEVWTTYFNEDSMRIGYMDPSGNIKTEAKYGAPIEPKVVKEHTFEHVVAIGEQVGGKWDGFYMNKAGKTFGRDSIFMYDFEIDLESEGYIRFMVWNADIELGLMGMFDKNGKVVVPAEYNLLSKVKNGTMIGLKGAKKECEDSACEYYDLVGGTRVLIDVKNKVLKEDITFEDYPDFVFRGES